MSNVYLTIRAYNAEGYQRDILTMNETQVQMNDTRVEDGPFGPKIDPSKFPEVDYFEIILKEYAK